MLKRVKEYSLAELLAHPVLSLVMTGDGIERRSIDLMLDAESGDRPPTEDEFDQPIVD
jgi:hypothetical protein